MATLNERILELENQINYLLSKINDLMTNTENKFRNPTTYVGNRVPRSAIRPIDVSAGKGQEFGGNIIWNNTELEFIPFGDEPDNPENEIKVKNYNRHTHSRFAGGALLIDALEFVEYDWSKTNIENKHSQQYWYEDVPIKKVKNSKDEAVDKIGKLALVFNADTKKWGVTAAVLDVKQCQLVEYDNNGDIALDENGNQKISPLYNKDSNKSSVVWDKNARCWRFYAVYAPGV